MKTKTMRLLMMAAVAAAIGGLLTGKEKEMNGLKLTSTAFVHNGKIPARYTGEGADVSPPLKWEGAPAGVKSWALICDDPDAPVGTWVHWVIYGLPAQTAGLPENVARKEVLPELGGAKQGLNSWGRACYGGPMPPPGHGVHHYHFRLYALDIEPALKPRATRQQLDAAMKGHILAETELVGLYERR
jgi:hypothetical protein